jgi:cyclopropane-fatty-acyl-phospholipid synthase
MLDESMTYTSGYWAHAETLGEAQTAKLDLLCRKLDIRPGDRVLDIGCGWGNFARHAAERYGAHVTGITVSTEQAELARERCRDLPVEIRLQDYRDVDGVFDHVVSIEMIEAVGARNVATYFRSVDRCLADTGRFGLQVISGDMLSLTSDRAMDQFCLWLQRYIFPDGYLPTETQLVPPRDTALKIQDWHRFGEDYERTLLAWADNVATGWDRLADRYDERFRRRWEFYLHGCAAAFRTGLIHVSQIVYSKGSSRVEAVR